MKKSIPCVCIILVGAGVRVLQVLMILFIIACNIKVDYRFMYDTAQISTIELVDVAEVKQDENGLWIHQLITVRTIEEKEGFLEEFSEIDCYEKYTNPHTVEAGNMAIKIQYINGHYELIAADGQSRYTGERYIVYAGWQYFDDEEFAKFISKLQGVTP